MKDFVFVAISFNCSPSPFPLREKHSGLFYSLNLAKQTSSGEKIQTSRVIYIEWDPFRNSSPSLWCSHPNKLSRRLIRASPHLPHLSGVPRYAALHAHASIWRLYGYKGYHLTFPCAPVVTQNMNWERKETTEGSKEGQRLTLKMLYVHIKCPVGLLEIQGSIQQLRDSRFRIP